MERLNVPLLFIDRDSFNYFDLQIQMRKLAWHKIAHNNWVGDYPYTPEAAFQIAHSGQHIFLHFAVSEKYVKAQYVRPNEAVWEDSCVEFFISFDGRQSYYNMEFNVLGTGLIGYGPQVKAQRARQSAESIAQVRTATSIVNTAQEKKWSMIWEIPITVFKEQPLHDLSGMAAQGNFYKCGDGLPDPHFISWAPIDFPKPNFHLPAFFGDLLFE